MSCQAWRSLNVFAPVAYFACAPSGAGAACIAGEQTWLQPILSLPDPTADMMTIAQQEAVGLFVERAQLLRLDFALVHPRALKRSRKSASGWMALRWRSSWPRPG